MKEHNLKKVIQNAGYDRPSDNLNINIMESIEKLEKRTFSLKIPKFNTFFIKFYFAALIALISILTIFNIQNIEIVNHNTFSFLSNIFSNSSLGLIPIISISLFIFLLIDRKISQKLSMRKG